MTARTLYLVRHGATAATAAGRYAGWDDCPLSPEGLAQAEEVARRLAALRPARLVASDLVRCVQTAEVIARATGLRVEPDPRLRELGFGRFAGKTYAEIRAAWPDRLEAWLRDPEHVAPPGGETLASLRLRALAALPREDRAVVVTHGGVIRAVFAHLTGRDLWSLDVPPGCLIAVRWDG